MKVTVISETKQEFLGKVYTLYYGERYLSRGSNRLHRVVYEHFNGDVPNGFHVHHKDHNTLNNNPENLECIEECEHISMHKKEWHSENPNASRDTINKHQHKCIEWHRSEEGRSWHKEHYQKTKDSLHKKISKICEQCGDEFDGLVRVNAVYCSNKCKSAARRASGVDNEERNCVHCGSAYQCNKYTKSKTCSIACSNRNRNVPAKS